ncbi:MAG: hypothetical protein AAB941_00645 [Patescibacteria group bacterium]
MSREIFEKETADIVENNYQRYLGLGGIINENDYQSALDRMNSVHTLDRKDPQVIDSIRQVVDMARYAKITLGDFKNVFDPRVILYVILRLDTKPEDVKYHHSQMSDQRIFGEVLRMLGDASSLDKLIKAYPNISFKYERGK